MSPFRPPPSKFSPVPVMNRLVGWSDEPKRTVPKRSVPM